MQKNVPKYTPDWVPTVRHVGRGVEARRVATRSATTAARCCGSRNQRAIEYHPALVRADRARPRDPPGARPRPARGRRRSPMVVARGPRSCAQALDDVGLAGAVKTSGAKGVHVFVPIDRRDVDRGRGRGAPAPSPRAPRALDPDVATTAFMKEDRGRQGVRRLDPGRRRDRGRGLQPAGPARACRCRSRSAWDDLDDVTPARLHHAHRARAPRRPRSRGPSTCRRRRRSPADLVDEGHAIPVARVQAMHEGKRRARARRDPS